AATCGDRARQYLIEEFIPGYEVALEGLVVNRRLHVLAVFDKPDPLDGPFFEETIYVTPSTVPAGLQAAIRDCADRAVRALGLVEGAVHAELRYNDRGPWLIELAARPIGGRCSAVLRFGTGDGGRGTGTTSLEEIILRHALGMPIASLEREPRAAGVMMIPIPGAGVLQEVRGVAEARAVPLVEDVQITAHPGERLVPFPDGSRYPGFIFARGETPVAVEAALREAHGRLQFVLEPGSGAPCAVRRHGASSLDSSSWPRRSRWCGVSRVSTAWSSPVTPRWAKSRCRARTRTPSLSTHGPRSFSLSRRDWHSSRASLRPARCCCGRRAVLPRSGRRAGCSRDSREAPNRRRLRPARCWCPSSCRRGYFRSVCSTRRSISTRCYFSS